MSNQSRLLRKYPFEANMVTVGDCLELMAQLPPSSIDAIVTDPPFAIVGGISNGMTSQADDQYFTFWFTAIIKEFIRVLKPDGCGFIWSDWRSESAMVKSFKNASERYNPWWVSQVIYHDREMVGMGKPFRNQVDRILFFRGKKFQNSRIPATQPNIIRSYWYYGKHEWHDAEKSLEVAEMFVKWGADEGEMVLDPFCGGATIAAACKRTGRKFITFETNEETAEVATSRLSACRYVLANNPNQHELKSSVQLGLTGAEN